MDIQPPATSLVLLVTFPGTMLDPLCLCCIDSTIGGLSCNEWLFELLVPSYCSPLTSVNHKDGFMGKQMSSF